MDAYVTEELGTKTVAWCAKYNNQRERETAIARFKHGETVVAITTMLLGGRGSNFPLVEVLFLVGMPLDDDSNEVFYACHNRAGWAGNSGQVKINLNMKREHKQAVVLRGILDDQNCIYPDWFRDATSGGKNPSDGPERVPADGDGEPGETATTDEGWGEGFKQGPGPSTIGREQPSLHEDGIQTAIPFHRLRTSQSESQ